MTLRTAALASVMIAFIVVACGGSYDTRIENLEATVAALVGDVASVDDDALGQNGLVGDPHGEPGPDSPTVSLSSVTIATGETAEVVLSVLNFEAPGLGAWAVDVTYDTNMLTLTNCEPLPEPNTVCNLAYAVDTLRIVGVTGGGFEGDTEIGRLTFRCDEAGESVLTVSIETLADGTFGDPQLVAAHVENGSITAIACDTSLIAANRRSAFLDATTDGCLAAVNRYADQFTPSAVARFKNNECPRYAEAAAKDLQDAYDFNDHDDATSSVWLDDKNVDFQAEFAAAPEFGCDHMVNFMEDISFEERFRSLTDDGFPSRFCFDLE